MDMPYWLMRRQYQGVDAASGSGWFIAQCRYREATFADIVKEFSVYPWGTRIGSSINGHVVQGTLHFVTHRHMKLLSAPQV